MNNTTRRIRWYWPGILAVPALGLIAQEVWTFAGLSLDGPVTDQLRSAAGWAAWAACPLAVVAATMAFAVWKRDRAAWWVAVAGGAATVAVGLLLVVLALLDPSTDPLVGLYQVVTPLIQLGPAVATGVAVIIIVVASGRRPTSGPVTGARSTTPAEPAR